MNKLCFFCLLLLLAFLIRFLFILFVKKPPHPSKIPIKTLVVLGSGGHTAEILRLLDHFDKKHYFPRVYVKAETDVMSGEKALKKEEEWQKTESPMGISFWKIPRSREVGQPFLTAIWPTLLAIFHSAFVVLKEKPKLILVNGPGTCIPVCAAALLFRLLFILPETRIVYVESVARTHRFSLSAKLLYRFRMADLVLVQWEELLKNYPRAVYAGRLY
mmetsp:Transcript_7331/g.14454  ORF Transcript_7331/g.14454 Transcript_7331/m.14454 type:complete len:217 (+) Transcript_7331:71-721(+)